MSTAFEDNFVLAQKARANRMAAALQGRGSVGGPAPDPNWDAFWQALQDKQDAASAAGQHFSADTSGIGQDSGGSMTPSYYSPQGIAMANANNQALSDEATRFRLGQAAVASANADASARQDANLRSFVDQDAVSRAFQPGLTREQSLAAAGPMAMQVGQVFQQRDAAGQALTSQKTKDALENAQGQAALIKANADADKAKADALSAPVQLSDAAINDNAKMYNQTGVMPAMGMKDPGNRQRIMNRAAELRAGQGSIASDKAAYKADSGSLVPLQKQRDAVGAFEGTALKNMQLFLDAAGKVVDTGSPLANMPARMISGKLAGSPDQAGYETARQVALTEIAKVINNPNLSGALSDSGRQEVMNFSPDTATLAQTVRVANLLKQDMANRRTELDRQIGEVKGRIANPASAPPAAAPVGGARQIGKYSVVVH